MNQKTNPMRVPLAFFWGAYAALYLYALFITSKLIQYSSAVSGVFFYVLCVTICSIIACVASAKGKTPLIGGMLIIIAMINIVRNIGILGYSGDIFFLVFIVFLFWLVVKST